MKNFLFVLICFLSFTSFAQAQEAKADSLKVCQLCTGTGFATCNPCTGTGKMMCITCGGSGTELCNRCSGVGQIFSYDPVSNSNKYTPCTSCGSSGRVGCKICQRSRHIVCTTCGGSGKTVCLHSHSKKKWSKSELFSLNDFNTLIQFDFVQHPTN